MHFFFQAMHRAGACFFFFWNCNDTFIPEDNLRNIVLVCIQSQKSPSSRQFLGPKHLSYFHPPSEANVVEPSQLIVNL